MNWDELTMAQKNELMQTYIRNGVTSLDDMRSHFNSYATGGSTNPDWDPEHPYHYHTASGEKVVVTPEDWEKHKGQSYFKQVEDAVLAEQAAHPGPEYIINPQFSEDLRRVYKGNMGPKYQNYSSFSGNLSQGYSFTPEGLVQDNQGNLYVQKGFRQTPRFTYDENNPLVFPVLEGRNQGNVTFYPVNMEKTIKPSLPISSIMNVDKEHESAIRKAQNQYEYPVTLWDILPTREGVISTYDNVYSTSPDYGDDYSKNYHPYAEKGAKQFFENYISNIIGREIKLNGPSYMWDDNGNFRNVYADDVFNLSPKEFNIVKKKLKDAKNKDYKFEKNKTEENLNKYKQEGLLTGNDEEVYRNSIKYLEDWISQDNPWLWGDEDRSPKPRKISRKEAEKKAVIEVGPLQVIDIKTFNNGGHLFTIGGDKDNPDDPPTSKIPTRNEYLAQRAAEEQQEYFLEGSRNRKESYELKSALNTEDIEHLQNIIQMGDKEINGLIEGLSKNAQIPKAEARHYLTKHQYPVEWQGEFDYFFNVYNDIEKQQTNAKKALEENIKYLANCIATATSNHPYPGHFVMGNQTFSANPRKYGYVEVPKEESKDGSLIQFLNREGIGTHMAIRDHVDREGNMYLNYGPGDYPSYKTNEKDWEPEGRKRFYNFVGNHQDSVRWNNEYEQLYGKHKLGGYLRRIDPI